MNEPYRIFVANIGYARGIDGSAWHHLGRSHRHMLASRGLQRRALDACKQLILGTDPHLCCLMEIDTGSLTSSWLNQYGYLAMPAYPFGDIASKYASASLRRFPLTRGKSNAFLAKAHDPFQRLYLSRGSKRLIYRIELPDCTLFFTHLSLRRGIRAIQLQELRALADKETRDVLIAGDFNILAGLSELGVLLDDGRYILANHPEQATFRLFGRRYLLDLCIASSSMASRLTVQVIDQPYSDHDALLIHIRPL